MTAGRPRVGRPRRRRPFRAVALALVLLLTPLLGLVPALVAGAASGTSADGRLTFSYTAPSPVTAGSSVTYTYTITNTTSDTFYRSSATDSNCSVTDSPTRLGPYASATYTCTVTNMQATTISTANISYYTYDEVWDPLVWFPVNTRMSLTTTVVVNPNPATTPPIDCTTPTVFIGANNVSASSGGAPPSSGAVAAAGVADERGADGAEHGGEHHQSGAGEARQRP